MKKKKKNNVWTAVLIALIAFCLGAIVSAILLYKEEPVKDRPKAARQSPPAEAPAVAGKKARMQAPSEEKHAGSSDVSPVSPSAAKPPRQEKEKTVVAKIVPPALPLKEIAVIIDDIGYDLKAVRELLGVDADVTFAILPLLPHSREAALTLHQAGRETLLHLPMEPVSYPKDKPGQGALFTDMNREEILYQLEKDLSSVPYVSGVNNHMGSKFMADEEKLTPVFQALKKKKLFFIDSRTTQASKTSTVAGAVGLTIASRKVFLDNERDYDKIYRILMNAAESSAGDPLIIIGHPYPETIRAIRDGAGVLRQKGVSIVPVSKLVKKTPSKGTS